MRAGNRNPPHDRFADILDIGRLEPRLADSQEGNAGYRRSILRWPEGRHLRPNMTADGSTAPRKPLSHRAFSLAPVRM